jgi:hypothetical protein
LLSTEQQKNLASFPRIKALIDTSVELSRRRMIGSNSNQREEIESVGTFPLGKVIPDRQQYFDVLQVQSEANHDSSSSDRQNANAGQAMLAYRFYEDVMDEEEYTKLAGRSPPVSREEMVPLLFPLDEFAVRSRMMKLGHDVGVVTNSEFGAVFSKLVLADFLQREKKEDFRAAIRPTMMIWGTIYQKSSSSIYSHLRARQSFPEQSPPRNILCDYQHMRFTQQIWDDDGIRSALGQEQLVAQRAAAIKRLKSNVYTKYNNYSTKGMEGTKKNIYPESAPHIFTDKSRGGMQKRKRRRIAEQRERTASLNTPGVVIESNNRSITQRGDYDIAAEQQQQYSQPPGQSQMNTSMD